MYFFKGGLLYKVDLLSKLSSIVFNTIFPIISAKEKKPPTSVVSTIPADHIRSNSGKGPAVNQGYDNKSPGPYSPNPYSLPEKSPGPYNPYYADTNVSSLLEILNHVLK